LAILFMLFGILAPNDYGYPVYAVWYSCSQRFRLSCLCCLVFLLPTILAILFMLFGILAPNDVGYPVYAVWDSCSQRFWLSCLCINRIANIVGSKNTKQHKQDSQNRWEQEYQTA
jgi:hypothetical protein